MKTDVAAADSYATFAEYYDLEYAAFDADLDFYRSFAMQANGPVLELGCGTGRVLQALEDLNLPLTGIDTSPAMLDVARHVVQQTTTLVECDMARLGDSVSLPHRPYWMAFSAINSFLHLPDSESQLAALRALRTNVVVGGLLLLDLMVPEPAYLASLDGRLQPEFSTTLENGHRLDKFVSRTHDLATQTIHTTVYFDILNPVTHQLTRRADSYDTRYIHRYELELLLSAAGWRLISLYGSYDLEPFDSDSERMIALATWGDMQLYDEDGAVDDR